MFDLRFFEIYRNAEYVARLAEGVSLSISLTLGAAAAGFLAATLIAITRNAGIPLLAPLSAPLKYSSRSPSFMWRLP